MLIQNTAQLAEEFAEIQKQIVRTLERLDGQVPGRVIDRFGRTLAAAGMAEAEAGDYAGALSSWLKTIEESLTEASKTCGAAIHVIDAATHRAKQKSGNNGGPLAL